MHYPHPIEISAKRKQLAVILSATVLIVGLVVYLWWPNEPFYHGHFYSYWLEECISPLAHLRRVEDLRSLDFAHRSAVAKKAVDAIGTNAIPTLLRYLETKGSDAETLPSVPGLNPIGGQSLFSGPRGKHLMAQMGFAMLGTNASLALPTLTALSKDKNPELRLHAFECLMNITPPSDTKKLVPILVSFKNDPSEIRQKAAVYLRSLLPALSAEEARQAGVYEAFPELRKSEGTGPNLEI